MELREAIEQAKKGNAVLFTGAGFSYGATNLMPAGKGNAVPTAYDLASIMSKNCEVDGTYQLPAISQYFESKHGSGELVRLLLNYFSISQVADHHKVIARIPWRRVYTTNYDNCFEFAALQSGIDWTPLTTDIAPTAKSHRCVHINGHVSSLTADSLAKQLKLTHSSYSAEAFSGSKWSQQFRQDIFAARALIFIGYSMADIDISRIVHQIPELKSRTFFITSQRGDPVSESLIAPYGSVHPIGIDGFANLTNEVEVTDDDEPYQVTWLKRYDTPEAAVRPDDAAAHDLILKGVISPAMLAWSLAEQSAPYMVRRVQTEEIINEITRGRRWLIVHSDLGNGKSLLKEQLSYLLSKLDFDVYLDSDYSLKKNEDLRFISRIKRKSVLMLDDDPDRFGTIDLIRSYNFENTTFIIFLRSTLFQLGERRYEDNLPEDFAEFDVNRLSDGEVLLFCQLFSDLGLWGDYTDKTVDEKMNLLKVDFERSIQRLILSVFENSDVGRKLIDEGKSIIASSDTVAQIVVMAFILNRLEHVPTPTLMSELLPNIDVWKVARSKEFRAAGEFIRFEQGIVRSRSSILASVILRSAVKADVLVETIEKIVRNLGKKNRNSSLHHVFTQLMRFPTIEGMIDHPRKREIIIGYFQSIKDLSFCQISADFWLHYAMARLTYGEFDIASKYFTTAKKLAKGNPKKLTDVNNHYARLLLDSRIKTDDYDDYFKAFELAHSILIEQMNRDDNRHYPYRQAKKYVEFISYRRGKLSGDELRRFIVSCRQVKVAISNLVGRLSYSGEIAECDRQMDRAIEIANAGTAGA